MLAANELNARARARPRRSSIDDKRTSFGASERIIEGVSSVRTVMAATASSPDAEAAAIRAPAGVARRARAAGEAAPTADEPPPPPAGGTRP